MISSPDNFGKRPPTVIFLHIPKAAGTTMHTLLSRVYRGKVVRDLDTGDLRRSIEDFKRQPAVEKDRIDLVKGHIPFGMHEGFTRSCTYITMLRDPVARIVSHYRYAISSPAHYLHREIVGKNMSLRDYVASGISEEMDNAMVRILSNNLFGIPFGACNPAMLVTAKENLSRYFSMVGLAERFDESVLLMKLELRWSSYPVYYNKKVSTLGRRAEPIDAKTIECIRSANALDMALYEYGRGIFESKLAARNEELNRELGRFQRRNGVFRVLAGAGNEVVSRVKHLLRGKRLTRA